MNNTLQNRGRKGGGAGRMARAPGIHWDPLGRMAMRPCYYCRMMAITWSAAGWYRALRDTEWSVWLMLALVLVPYGWGVVALWRRAGVGRGLRVSRVACYALGWLVLLFALASPLDTMSDALFSAHMTQHLLLVAVIPPLLVAGAPPTAMAWAVRHLTLGRHRAWWLHLGRVVASIAGVFTIAWVALGLHTAAMWTWHLPALYQLALAHPWWHALEHACFLGTALLLWWSVMRPHGVRRNGYGVGVLVMLATAMQSGALGALFAASRTPWYSAHEHTTAAWGITPLADQQLAGLIMWVPGGMIYVVAACVLFLAWMQARPGSGRVTGRDRHPERSDGAAAAQSKGLGAAR